MLKLLKDGLGKVLTRHKDMADLIVFVMSFIALSLFVVTEVLSYGKTALPEIFGLDATSVILVVRFVAWATFVVHFLAFGLLSGNLRNYARGHVTELLICLAWFPYSADGLLRHMPTVVSVEMVQLLGTLANAAHIVAYFTRRLSSHPFVVMLAAFFLVVLTASGLLLHVEPETFTSWFDAIWYSVVTATTIGYGDIVPKTVGGRLVGMGLMVCGIGLAGALIGVVSQMMQKRLRREKENAEMPALTMELAQNRALMERVAAALERDNLLKEQLLAELKSRRKGDAE